VSCEFSHYDGAYVLGALSPAERSDYQAHLAGCDDCTRAVQELAGLPGLLGRVPADVLESPGEEPLPDTLLPALLRETRRSRRRRARVAVAATAAAAVVIAGGSLAIGLAVGDDGADTVAPSPTETTNAPTGQPMKPVGPEVMSASLAMTSVSWGTKLDLTCSYPPPPDDWGNAEGWAYAMFVVTNDGHVEQVATWRALPGKTMQLAAATAASREDISSVEIRTMTGEPLLRLEA
jgi:anti-sigma factor RsiW